MVPGLLVVSYGMGIVWADQDGPIPIALLFLWLTVVGGLGCGFCWRRRNGGRAGWDLRENHGPVLRGSTAWVTWGVPCVIGLFFLAGYGRLETRLESARSDRARAEAGSREEIRFAQARVGGRRGGRTWGDEVTLEAVRAIDGGRPMPTRLLLYLNRDRGPQETSASSRADRLLWPGAWVRVGLRVGPLERTRNPGTLDREHREARRGLGARARLVKPDWVMKLSHGEARPSDSIESGESGTRSSIHSETDSFAARRAAWRQRVADRFQEVGAPAGLVRALALGDRTGVSSESREAFRRLGLSHLLAISGLHIGFIAGLAGWAGLRVTVWLCPRARKLRVFDGALGFACCAAAFYAWATDAGTSVERASLLFGLYAFCRLALRRIPPSAALAWVALVLLVADPAALFDTGAQLSFSACWALIAAGFWRMEPGPGVDAGERVSARVLRTLGTTLRASLVVSLGTAPLLIQHGFSMVTFSPLFNVFAIPWTGLVVLPCSLAVTVLLDVLPRNLLLAGVAPARLLEVVAVELAGRLPDGPSEAVLSMPIFLALVFMALLAIRRERWRLAAALWVAASMGGASPVSLGSPIPAAPRVIFFDVGQGDATLIQGKHAAVLIDTGPGPPDGTGGASLVGGLRAAKVRRIDVLVLTHGDLDHRAGLLRVIEAYEVGELWLPLAAAKDEALSKAASMARLLGTRVVWKEAVARDSPAPTRLPVGQDEIELEVLWPKQGQSGLGRSRNENSLVLRVVANGRVFLFAADIGIAVENELLKDAKRLDADVLKIAHHGSRGSSSAAFIRSVSPSVAVLSAPCDPARGLPNAHAIARILESGAELWWTGRDGAVTVAGEEGSPMRISGWGSRRKCSAR